MRRKGEIEARSHTPEHLQEGLAVGGDLVHGEEGVAVDGHGVALHAEVAAQLHIEAHLEHTAGPVSCLLYRCTAVKRPGLLIQHLQ